MCVSLNRFIHSFSLKFYKRVSVMVLLYQKLSYCFQYHFNTFKTSDFVLKYFEFRSEYGRVCYGTVTQFSCCARIHVVFVVGRRRIRNDICSRYRGQKERLARVEYKRVNRCRKNSQGLLDDTGS
jgi:hypothetical protein